MACARSTGVSFIGLALIFASSTFAADSAATRWDKAPTLCRDAIASGWQRSDPLDEESSAQSEVKIPGGATLCAALKKFGTGGTIRLHAGTGASGHLSFIGEAETESGKALILEALQKEFLRDAAILNLTVPTEIAAAIKAGIDEESRERGIEYRVITTSREAELAVQPDLDPKTVPAFGIEVQAAPDDGGED